MEIERNIRILGTGKYLPKRKVTSEYLDGKFNLSKGEIEKRTGVKSRYYIEDETATEMGALAGLQALERANLTPQDIDLIISASGVNEQPIPPNSCLISQKLGLENSKTPCCDIESACMSFFTALNIIADSIELGRYRNALIVSTDITSVGVDWSDLTNFPLFGDGAAAVVIDKDPEGNSKIILAHSETHSRYAHLSQIKGGGNRFHPENYSEETAKDFRYEMHGKEMGKAMFKEFGKGEEGTFLNRAFSKIDKGLEEIVERVKAIIPHQVSPNFIKILKNRLNFPSEKFINLAEEYGNMLSASVPFGLDEAITKKNLQRGDEILIIAGGSGISLGTMYLRY
ncbi:beta-ketoacyl-ACP synthase III [Candidatus Pacearchaeota archaeon]|nr:beta-ketoacyl-ACP synthase III [Candidatus Pacearchaeota archaeon]